MSKGCDCVTRQWLTWADDTSILGVFTVVISPSIMRTVADVGLIPSTSHIVKPNSTCSRTKLSTARFPNCNEKSQLATGYICSVEVPVVVTNSPPFSLIEYLNTTLSGVIGGSHIYISPIQSQVPFTCREELSMGCSTSVHCDNWWATYQTATELSGM